MSNPAEKGYKSPEGLPEQPGRIGRGGGRETVIPTPEPLPLVATLPEAEATELGLVRTQIAEMEAQPAAIDIPQPASEPTIEASAVSAPRTMGKPERFPWQIRVAAAAAAAIVTVAGWFGYEKIHTPISLSVPTTTSNPLNPTKAGPNPPPPTETNQATKSTEPEASKPLPPLPEIVNKDNTKFEELEPAEAAKIAEKNGSILMDPIILKNGVNLTNRKDIAGVVYLDLDQIKDDEIIWNVKAIGSGELEVIRNGSTSITIYNIVTKIKDESGKDVIIIRSMSFPPMSEEQKKESYPIEGERKSVRAGDTVATRIMKIVTVKLADGTTRKVLEDQKLRMAFLTGNMPDNTIEVLAQGEGIEGSSIGEKSHKIMDNIARADSGAIVVIKPDSESKKPESQQPLQPASPTPQGK